MTPHPMYTTIPRVRTLSGFDDTTNITDENIAGKIRIASGMVDGAVGYIYTLPLPYHFINTIAFQGKGTGSWNLIVTINGATYAMGIVLWDTATAMADKFRIAAADATGFLVDALGSGSVVTIISTADSTSATTAYAQVNVTAATQAEGIKWVIGTRLRRYPVMIEQITAEISTALLLIDIYGVESQDTGKDGQTRMEIINAMLQKLQGVHESKQRITIFDEVTGAEIAVTSTLDVISYPNDTSETDPTDPTSPHSWMNQTF